MTQAPTAEGTARATAEGEGAPELSVILVTDGLDLIAEALSHLSAQTAADRIELVLASPRGTIDPKEAAERLPAFNSIQVIEADSRNSPPAARAACVLAARAPVVAFTETHCFPEPDWADALIAAHRGPWSVVGPEIHNENPQTSTSWGNLLVDYAPWLAPIESGPVPDLPGHNSSYKRELLLSYGDDLGALLASESIMHWDIRERGHGLYQEAGAKVHHRNITELRAGLIEHFHNGRCFGALRSRRWSRGRRALYAAASPLIPLVRLRRIAADARSKGHGDRLRGALPTIVSKLIVHAAGEFTGYAFGPGDAVREMAVYELDRDLYAGA